MAGRANTKEKEIERRRNISITRKRMFKEGTLDLPLSSFKIGRIVTEKEKKRLSKLHKDKHRSPETEFKKGHKLTNEQEIRRRKNIANAIKGTFKISTQKENHWNWKGGITYISQGLRTMRVYKEWRKKVFERDNWTCQKCNNRGGILQAHHIKSFIRYPDLRLNVDNGLTLHKGCHKINMELIENE